MPADDPDEVWDDVLYTPNKTNTVNNEVKSPNQESSLLGLSGKELNLFGYVVGNRIQLESSTSKLEKLEEELKNLKINFEREEKRLAKAISEEKEIMLARRETVLKAEDKLRSEIINSLLVGRVHFERPQELAPEPIVEQVEEIGRAE